MKRFSPLFALLILVTSYGVKAQNSGGPDLFGYTWQNSLNVPGPTYEWIDISTTGTEITGLADDNVSEPINMGMDFHFYWTDYSRLWVGSNGYIVFGTPGMIASDGPPTNGFPPFPNGSSINNVIAPYLADLTFANANGTPVPTAKAYYQRIGSRFIVSFISVPFWNGNAGANQVSGENTFQIVLDAADSSITFNYQRLQGPFFNGYMNYSVAGIEDATGRVGLTLFRNLTNVTDRSFKISYPRNSTYRFLDAEASFLNNDLQYAATRDLSEQPLRVQAGVKNAGTVDIGTEITCRLLIYNQDITNIIHRDTIRLTAGLPRGKDSLLTFPRPITAITTAGNYQTSLQITVAGVGPFADQNRNNNNIDGQLTVTKINDADSTIVLGYDNGTYLNSQDEINAANVGVYFEPPFLPQQVIGIEFDAAWPNRPVWQGLGVNSNDSLAPFELRIFSGGSIPTPATQIASVVIPNEAATLIVDTVGSDTDPQINQIINYRLRHNVNLATPINMPAQGLYVGIYQERNTRFLWNYFLSDIRSPFANRGFEIVAGAWAAHRSRTTLDFPIRLILKTNRTSSIPRENIVTNWISSPYPNPATSFTNIPVELSRSGEVIVKVYSMTGQLQFEKNQFTAGGEKTNIMLPTHKLSSGVYLVQVQSPEGKSTQRIVVR